MKNKRLHRVVYFFLLASIVVSMLVIAGNSFMQHMTFDCHETAVVECPTQEILSAFALGGITYISSIVIIALSICLMLWHTLASNVIVGIRSISGHAPPWYRWEPLFQRLFSDGILHPRQYA